MIDYYEDIISPTITVKIQVINDGGTIKDVAIKISCSISAANVDIEVCVWL